MKKEELLEIGLTEEQASKVFAMNGVDVEGEKAKTNAAKVDLADAQQSVTACGPLQRKSLRKNKGE